MAISVVTSRIVSPENHVATNPVNGRTNTPVMPYMNTAKPTFGLAPINFSAKRRAKRRSYILDVVGGENLASDG